MAAGDLNDDGWRDLATADGNSGGLSVILNRADASGTFDDPVNYTGYGVPTGIAVADVNGDGRSDIATADYADPCDTSPCPIGSHISVLLQKRAGTFRAPINTLASTREGAASIALADLNGDGNLDAAVGLAPIEADKALIAIMLGNGDGTFDPAPCEQGGGCPTFGSTYSVAWSIKPVDLNGDGIRDLVTSGGGGCGVADSGVFILLGNGDGTFYPKGGNDPVNQPGRYYTGCSGSPAVHDFDGDGILDVAVTGADFRQGTEGVYTLVGHGDGTFTQTTGLAASSSVRVRDLAAADFNGDGAPDLAGSEGYSDGAPLYGVYPFPGNGDGTFQQGPRVATNCCPNNNRGSPDLVTADFNKDGWPDLATAVWSNDQNGGPRGGVSVLLNRTTGVLAFGDSVAAGYGLGRADGRDDDNPHAYSARLAERMGLPYRNYAVSGACASTADGTWGSGGSCEKQPGVAAQIIAAGRQLRPSVITLTVGADDIVFGDCLADELDIPHKVDDPGMNPCYPSNLQKNIAKFQYSLVSDLNRLQVFYPDVPVLVTHYYNPLPAPPKNISDRCAVLFDPLTLWINFQEAPRGWFRLLYMLHHRYLLPEASADLQSSLHHRAQSIVNDLNDAIDNAVASTDATATAVPVNFRGHDLCKSRDVSWVFGPRISLSLRLSRGGDTVAKRTFEPVSLPYECPHPNPQDERSRSFHFEVTREFPWNAHLTLRADGGINCLPHPTYRGQKALADFLLPYRPPR